MATVVSADAGGDPAVSPSGLPAARIRRGDQTLAEFLERGGYSDYFIRYFITALVATVWSCEPETAGRYPARYLFMFLQHHGMLRVFGSPAWRTVVGGSREYVRRITERVTERGGSVRTGTPVVAVRDTGGGVSVTDGNGATEDVDAVVIATHPDQALAMLAEPTAAQREILSSSPYSQNLMQLHTDTSVLPRTPGARGSWNHLARPQDTAGCGGVVVTYDMTRLMHLPAPGGTRHLVTLNAPDLVAPDSVITTRHYRHPVYTPTSVAASRRAAELDTDRIVFAGAWQGWGFHEDGARSGLAAAGRLVDGGDAARHQAEPAARVLRTTVTHARSSPIQHRFRHRSWMWLVDLDHLPRHGAAGRWRGVFRTGDHLGTGATIRENVVTLLAERGVTSPVGRIRMAAMPRAWGNGFNPLSVFWCDTPDGAPLATVLEVHNTYGDRHAYVIEPDERGRADTEKVFYVSPFHGTGGTYAVTAPRPVGGRVRVGITLRVGEDYSFTASVQGTPAHDGAPGWFDSVRAAPAALVSSALIRAHGIWLWARGLPVRPRPAGGMREDRHTEVYQ